MQSNLKPHINLKLTILLLFVFFNSFGQEQTDNAGNKFELLLQKASKQTLNSDDRKTLETLTYQIQNYGFSLEEHHNNYSGSLERIDSALKSWQVLIDTVNQANLYKYKGYLLAHLKKFPEAEANVRQAIFLFGFKGNQPGVAVSYFDMSKVYEMENQLDSALAYAFKASNFWQTRQDTFRMVTVNNQLINLYCKKGNFAEAKKLQQTSKVMVDNKELHWRPVIDFYYLSAKLYSRSESRLSQYYQNQYKKKCATINHQQSDPQIKSYYDN